jgi:hypothetical protein
MYMIVSKEFFVIVMLIGKIMADNKAWQMSRPNCTSL